MTDAGKTIFKSILARHSRYAGHLHSWTDLKPERRV